MLTKISTVFTLVTSMTTALDSKTESITKLRYFGIHNDHPYDTCATTPTWVYDTTCAGLYHRRDCDGNDSGRWYVMNGTNPNFPVWSDNAEREAWIARHGCP